MCPPLLLHLPDPRVYEGVAGVAVHVGLQLLVVVVPGDVDADGVALHLAVEGIVSGHRVEELPPDQLRHDGVGARRLAI